ncbi:MAG TPA: glycosyltransferase [Flavobacterium sp.]|nr:glycosyltransferase [Flavobacterium sp.]
MPEAIVITPVKDSLQTTLQTISSIIDAEGNFEYIVYNDFSTPETTSALEKDSFEKKFKLVNLSDITKTPSPNYKLVLQLAQQIALEKKCSLIIIESDVVIKKETIVRLVDISKSFPNTGLVGAITVDKNGNYNFPYTFEKIKSNEIISTNHSLSFCCTLISVHFLQEFDFKTLSQNKDWFDVYISRQSKKIGLENYLAKELEVLHQPHSSRPWKNLKYKNPFLYYAKKLFKNRDRI